MSALTPLDVALAAILDGLALVAPESATPEAAIGFALAAPVFAPGPVPARATALRAGLAVSAQDLVGAAPGAPALFASRPARGAGSAALPEGCDAVLPSEAAEGAGPVEIAESAAPGQHVRLPGHDLAAGARLAAAGATVDVDLALACRLAGLTRLAIRVPAIHVAPHDDPAADWLTARLGALGVRLVADAGAAHLAIGWDAGAPPRLALEPGGASAAARRGGQVVVTLAPRFDAALGTFCGVIWPVVARLTGRRLQARERPLAAKLVSTIGVTDLALLAETRAGWRPLAVGQATLETLLAADAVALLGPACEGLPAGAPLAAIRLDAPFAETFE